ncbi:formamidopyrimidine-DNA glycosylase [Actinorhabdospora filicis]|uniref:Formamidopyrimidine-DNA glycosylase n=1 Tax=Actinorhabdospora filicis TaxID=1785913 RepID=A0A9W6SR56_9ACTN|nr:DNA-formamidopyrimidine glycosylase family protein [Actinorhabdospora filicis]GLZ79226.1 formamidopyrimidine-DNA glycosylase [Actinorhabdospora filicis]
MPELPEVEALAGFLRDRLAGRSIARVDVASFAALKTFDPPVTALTGLAVTGASRRGKFVDVQAGDLHLVFHLARAGWLQWRDALPAAPLRPGKGPIALRVVLDDGSGFDLTEQGTTKRLAVHVVRSPGDIEHVATLGPEPLTLSREDFAALLAGRRAQIKGLLRDQKVIAGIGNAYSDEILHAAKMSPFKLASSFTDEETGVLYEAMLSTLRAAVAHDEGVAAGRLKAHKKAAMRVHGRAGEACPVCGDVIRSVSFADSSLEYCATCQTGGKPLADRRTSKFLK